MTLAAIAPSPPAAAGAAAIAICSADRALGERLARVVHADAGLAGAGVVDDAAALTRLLAQTRVALVVADAPTAEQLRRWTRRYRDTAFVAIVAVPQTEAQAGALDLLRAGARALLARGADEADIAATLTAVRHGLCVLPTGLLSAAPAAAPSDHDAARAPGAGETALTARELEVLVALADGLSNKAIARRLGISVHTAKFHVGGILAKLDADSRTEAVAKAAQRGLVML
jgi:two-component system, NarL family, response regulator YdfI